MKVREREKDKYVGQLGAEKFLTKMHKINILGRVVVISEVENGGVGGRERGRGEKVCVREREGERDTQETCSKQ